MRLVVFAFLSACSTAPTPPAAAPPASPPVAVPAPPAPVDEPGACASCGDLDVQEWLQGETDLSGTTLVVFWELWCPHCRKELPELQALHDRDDLRVVALTRLSRDVQPRQAHAFVEEHALTFPVAVGGHALAAELGVRGVPSAALYRDGEVVWRGHPARFDPDAVL